MGNYSVHFKDLPCRVKAFTFKHEDGYSIIINARLSYEQQRKAFFHELHHIDNGDFDSGGTVAKIENCAS